MNRGNATEGLNSVNIWSRRRIGPYRRIGVVHIMEGDADENMLEKNERAVDKNLKKLSWHPLIRRSRAPAHVPSPVTINTAKVWIFFLFLFCIYSKRLSCPYPNNVFVYKAVVFINVYTCYRRGCTEETFMIFCLFYVFFFSFLNLKSLFALLYIHSFFFFTDITTAYINTIFINTIYINTIRLSFFSCR